MSKKYKIRVKNGLKDKSGVLYGQADTETGVIRINIKAHKRDKDELASTIKHEILHIRHPKMTEKEVLKRSRKTKLSQAEKKTLLAKLL